MQATLYRARLLEAPTLDQLHEIADGALLVDESGRILERGNFGDIHAGCSEHTVVDFRPFLIIPGLVDLHTHLPQYGAVAQDGLELLPWLETHIYPAEARFSDPQLAAQTAEIFFRDLLSVGTTTAVVYSSVHFDATHAAFEAAERCGIRVVIGKVMMDRHSPSYLQEDTDESLSQSEALCERWHGKDHGRLQYAFSPRFAPACSSRLLHQCAALAEKFGAYVQTHLSENLHELEWVKRLFPGADSYTDVYRHAGMLGPRTLLGHGLYLDQDERIMIRNAGASIVHCPRSNAFLKSGIMPIGRWLQEGLMVGLGTDVGAGTSLSLWEEMAFACQASKLLAASNPGPIMPTVNPVLAFHLATVCGAKALGWSNRIGGLNAGMDADFLVVDPLRVNPGGLAEDTPQQMLARLIYRSDPRMIRATFVRGKRCFTRQD